MVAAHGNDEVATLRAGLEAGLRYVGLVASRRRGAAVVEELRADGLSKELLDALETPAGLDIGAHPRKVALAILGRIIAVRRSEHEATPAAAPVTAVDPVCGMTVVVKADTLSLEHDGVATYFCCAGCRRKFEEERGLARSDG